MSEVIKRTEVKILGLSLFTERRISAGEPFHIQATRYESGTVFFSNLALISDQVVEQNGFVDSLTGTYERLLDHPTSFPPDREIKIPGFSLRQSWSVEL